MAWNPSLHPRGPDGRFTKSFARPATSRQKSRIAAARKRFKARPPFRSPQDAAGFLSGMSTNKTRAPGQMDRFLAQLRQANQALRSGDPDPSGLQAEMKPTTEDVTVFRSVPASEFGSAPPADLRGFVVRDAGFFPASAAPTRPVPGEVRMTIDVPAGTSAAGSPDTSELVLDAGTEMSVDEVTTAPDGSTEMHLTALPGEGAPGQPDAPEQSSPEGSDKPAGSGETAGGVADVIDSRPPVLQNDEAGRAWQRNAIDQLGQAMNGTFAGLNVEVTGATPFMGGPDGEDPGVMAQIRLTDADGNEVGTAQRAVYRDENGNLAAVHEELVLDPSVQGRGFASEFNRNLTDWYRSQGIGRIELTANVDVGGYSWASHGYDFHDRESANSVLSRLEDTIASYRARGDDSLQPQIDAAQAVLDRARSAEFGSPDFPSPYDISQAGRTDGAKAWLGKDTMLGAAWEGVKWL